MDFCNNFTPEDIAGRDGFSSYNHITVTDFPDGGAVGELAVSAQSLNPHGIVHGGCLASLADTVAGWAVAHATGRDCVTVNYCFNFLRPAKGTNQKIVCRATPEKLGRTLCVYKVNLSDDAGETVATGDFTFFLMGPMEDL